MTPRRTKSIATTGELIIDGYQAETWFILLTRTASIRFVHLVGGRLYCLLFIQAGGNNEIIWPADINASNVSTRDGSVTVQTFIANGKGPTDIQAIGTATYA